MVCCPHCNMVFEVSQDLSGDSRQIRDTDMSVRTKNILGHRGIETVGQLRKMSQRSLLRLRGFGAVCLEEIADFLGPSWDRSGVEES